LNEYSISYMYIPGPPAGIVGLRGMNLSLTAQYSDVEAWITPFSYSCWGAFHGTRATVALGLGGP